MNLRLSVVSICRNDAGGLARTLKSTFKNQQSFDCWEQIIVDGASTDGSFNAIAPYKGNPHLGWHVSEPDKGIYNAMNKGAAHARGDYLLFLNSGDELMPGVLEKVFSSAFDADIAYGDESVVGNTGREGTWSVAEEDFTPAFFLLSGFPHQSCFISRTWFWKLGGYDESLRIVGDTEFLLRSRLNPDARIVRLPFVVSRYRLDGLSSNPRFARARMEERKRVMASHFGQFAANRAAQLVLGDMPWISAESAAAAKADPALARCIRRFSAMAARMWKHRVPRLLLSGTMRACQMAVSTFRGKHRNP